MQSAWQSLIVLTLAWGVGAIGSVYAWAYMPLIVACMFLGTVGLMFGRAQHPKVLSISIALVATAILFQLVPLSPQWLDVLSPRLTTIVLKRELLPAINGIDVHPLSIDPQRTWLGIAFCFSFSIFLLGVARNLTRDAARRMAAALTALGSLLAMAGVVQMATSNGKIYGVWPLVQGGTPFGPFVNKNHFAGWMLMAIPVAIGYFMALLSRGRAGRRPGFRNFVLWFGSAEANRAVLSAFAIVLMTLSLVFTLSRSGFIALMISLIIAVPVMIRRLTGSSHRVLATGFVAALILAAVSWVGLDQVVGRFAQVEVTGLDERPAIWSDTIQIIRDFWLTGTGFNTFGTITPFYQTAVPGQHLREAHNDYLQLIAEGGLLLSIPILFAILNLAHLIRRRLHEDQGSIWWIRTGAITGLCAIALQSAVDFSLQIPGNAVLFAVVAALAIHDGRQPSRNTQPV